MRVLANVLSQPAPNKAPPLSLSGLDTGRSDLKGPPGSLEELIGAENWTEIFIYLH